jgi:DNA-binding transcriptional LysR family regulator
MRLIILMQWMHMIELRRLRYLVVLAKRLSYSRAAEDLGLSQSALTRAIQSLERDVGMRLFDRDRAAVSLTEQGRWVVEKAEALLVSATDFDHQLGAASKGAEGRTRFGLTALPASAFLPTALAGRLSAIPAYAHEVIVRDVETLWLQLAMSEIEFMVCSGWSSAWPIPNGLPVRVESLGHLPISLIVRHAHPLTGAGHPGRKFPMLVSSSSSTSGPMISRLRDSLAASVQVIEDFRVLASLVRDTDAIWLTSSFAVAEELASSRFRELPLPPELEPRSFELSMYSLVRRSQSPAALQLGQAFRQRIRELHQILPAR